MKPPPSSIASTLGNCAGPQEVEDKGGELEELGAKLQSLEDVGDGDEELEELGENLQSLEGVTDGKEHGHGGDLGDSKITNRPPGY